MFDYLVFIFSFSSLVETIIIFDSTNMVLFLFLFCVLSDWIDTTHESPTCNLDFYIYGQFRPLYKFQTCVQIVWIYWFSKNKVETFYFSMCFLKKHVGERIYIFGIVLNFLVHFGLVLE